MKHDHSQRSRNKWIHARVLPFAAAFLFCINLRAQVPEDFPVLSPLPDSAIRFLLNNIDLLNGPEKYQPTDYIIPHYDSFTSRTIQLYDSLKLKASKTLVTRKLYEWMVVPSRAVENRSITGASDADYIEFRGKKIRNISIRRLNVFGTDINNPQLDNARNIEAFLNRTHFNTNELIIRKNLLFTEGDTISPLTLSDNERILRQLPYIHDARIVVIPVSGEESDIVVITKDIYSIAARAELSGIKSGSVSVYDRNIFGMGHEFGVEVPWNSRYRDSPGIGVHYSVNNISRSFINMNLYYNGGLGRQTFGLDLSRSLVSSQTRYAFGISMRQMFTSEDLDSLPLPEPLRYNLRDYWFLRSFLLDEGSVARLILGVRYTNNNVSDKPNILPDSYYHLQKYRIYLASASLSFQKYYKTSLIYGYGRVEDIPYGSLLRLTWGREINEFKERTYLGADISMARSARSVGYFYGSAGIGTFINSKNTEQGLLSVKLDYFSNLVYLGAYRIRNFIKAEYIRGFSRYTDERIYFGKENGFTGFSNDSISGRQRLYVSLESVAFHPVNLYGFRFAFFAFADFALLSETNQVLSNGSVLSGIGGGIRVRNDNLVFNTFQIRLGYFPLLPEHSRVNYISVSGEQLLRPSDFEPGKPSLIRYR